MYICVYVCLCVCVCTGTRTHIGLQEQLARSGSLFLPCRSWESSSGPQAWWDGKLFAHETSQPLCLSLALAAPKFPAIFCFSLPSVVTIGVYHYWDPEVDERLIPNLNHQIYCFLFNRCYFSVSLVATSKAPRLCSHHSGGSDRSLQDLVQLAWLWSPNVGFN